MVARIGPLATTSCEPRQARKGAAAAVASGAGVWRVGVATLFRKAPDTRG
jgi:hypothetical protein